MCFHRHGVVDRDFCLRGVTPGTAIAAETAARGIVRLTLRAFHGLQTHFIALPEDNAVSVASQQDMGNKRARLERLELPTRCLEGSRAAFITDWICMGCGFSD